MSSPMKRVLPPQAEAPEEDLVSLVYFYEADHDAVVEALRPPIGKPNDYPPVVSAACSRITPPWHQSSSRA